MQDGITLQVDRRTAVALCTLLDQHVESLVLEFGDAATAEKIWACHLIWLLDGIRPGAGPEAWMAEMFALARRSLGSDLFDKATACRRPSWPTVSELIARHSPGGRTATATPDDDRRN